MSEESPSDHNLEAPHSAFFAAWARVVLKLRFPLLALMAVITVLSVHQIKTRLVVDPTTRGFFGKEHPATRALNDLESDFGSDALIHVVIEGDVFTMPFLERMRDLHRELERVDVELPGLKAEAERAAAQAHEAGEADGQASGVSGEDVFGDGALADFGGAFGGDDWGEEQGGSVVDQVISLVNVRQTRWRDGGLWVGGLLDEWPSEAELPMIRERVMADSTLVGQVIGEGGRHAVVTVRMQNMEESDRNIVFAEVDKIVEGYRDQGMRAWVAGPAALNASMTGIMMKDFRRLMAVGMLLIVVIVTVLFRHPLGVIGPVLVVAQSALWTLGVMAFFGAKMTFISNILPLFLICVGMGDSVHLQSVYRDARKRGMPNREAIVDAVAATGVPVLFTTLTTALGLVSFRFASLGAIREMGMFGALGVSIALLLSIVLLPIVLTFNKRSLLGAKPVDRGPDFIDRMLHVCNVATLDTRDGPPRRRIRGLVLGFGLAGLAAIGAFRLAVHHDPLAWIPQGYGIRDAFDVMDAEVGGTSGVALLISPKTENGLKDRNLMLGLQELEEHVEAYRDPSSGDDIVGTTTGVLDVVRESHRAIKGGQDEHYKVPDTQRGVVDMFTLFENSGPDELKRLTTVDMSRALMIFRVKWMEASSYAPLTEHIKNGVDDHLGAMAEVRFTGAVFSMFDVISDVISDLLRSFSLAFVVITLTMIALLRGIKLGVIAMVPNLMPIVATMGFMGWAGIALNGANLMLASIAIGIAVDDTVHFLHQFRSHYDAHGKVEAALTHSFQHSGRAMVSTSIILCGGFLVFTVSDMRNISEFGLLIALAIALALLVDLLFLPALLRAFYRDREPAEASAVAPASAAGSAAE